MKKPPAVLATDIPGPLQEEAPGGGGALQTVQCPVSSSEHMGVGICKTEIASHSFSWTVSLHLD